MRILFCCEFYWPSVGGVQEVIKQLAERLVVRGHQVTVATTELPSRKADVLNGVRIKQFAAAGNQVRGMTGDLESYREFILSHEFDVIMVKAAQQWTFDALWPILSQVKARKVFVPCGFSGLYERKYQQYFQRMPDILRQFDHLIFYAAEYRDINFTRLHGISNYSIIPNGASEQEFLTGPDPLFRERWGIGKSDFLFLTVGSFTGFKGHFEVVSAYSQLKVDFPTTLILNGNMIPNFEKKAIKTKFKHLLKRQLTCLRVLPDTNWERIVYEINSSPGKKRVLVTNLNRSELIQAYLAADLFVFASNIEYSPLVLFEAAAAGTPFLSVPVGNAEEIADWTQGGEVCPALRDNKGYTRVDPAVLAAEMARLAKDQERLHELSVSGRSNWLRRFTWDRIVQQYEQVLQLQD